MKRVILLLLGITIIAAIPLGAQNQTGNARSASSWQVICAADIEKLCTNKQQPLTLCLAYHQNKLSTNCAAVVAEWSRRSRKSNLNSWLGDCRIDAEKLCAGQTALTACLTNHQNILTAKCSALIVAWDQKSAPSPSGWPDSCYQDVRDLCAGARYVNMCMRLRRSEWSAECKNSVSVSR